MGRYSVPKRNKIHPESRTPGGSSFRQTEDRPRGFAWGKRFGWGGLTVAVAVTLLGLGFVLEVSPFEWGLGLVVSPVAVAFRVGPVLVNFRVMPC